MQLTSKDTVFWTAANALDDASGPLSMPASDSNLDAMAVLRVW